MGYFIQRDEIGTILGGRYDYYNLMLRKLFKNISKYHAKLVFFLPGKSHTDDLPIFIPKAEFFYKNSMEIFDKIRQQIDLQTIKNSFSYHIRNTYAFRYNFRKLLSKYGEFRITYIEHNREIARYAKQHRDQVLAIISNDTDFMVFDGDYEFWITGSINATEMQCTRYNRHELYRRLGFTNGSFEMRLLSALCGSNYLPIYVVSKFITHLTKSNSDKTKYGKIWSVSAYVRQQTIEMVDGKLKYDLHKISRDVFGDDYETAELNAISNGIARYDLEFPESDEFCDGSAKKNGFLRFCQLHDSFIYKLVTDDIFLVPDSSYIDYQRFRTKHFAQLILPILMKICGILFKDDKPRPATRQICMKHAHDEPCKLTDETIIYPTSKTIVSVLCIHLVDYMKFAFFSSLVALPELFDLIFKWNETTFDKYRGPLIEWVLGLNDGFVAKVNSIKQFKNNLSAVIITLEYLIKVFFSLFSFLI